LIAHPECEEPILEKAAFIGSTSALLKHVQSSPQKRFIVATEPGIIHQMKRLAPGKEYLPAPPDANCSCNECPYMKLNTLEKLHACMVQRKPEITLAPEIIEAALTPIRRMLAMS
jgi:quinolinate synthase